MGISRLPIYIINKVITTEYLVMALIVIPFMLGAQILGRFVYNKIHPDHFQRLMLAFLTLLAFARLISEWI